MNASLKKFPNIAKFIRDNRGEMSQIQLAEKLGYGKTGQFISNVERGLCSIPSKKYKELCKVLNVFPEELERALMLDCEFEIKRNLYPEKIKQLQKEYDLCSRENTNLSSNKVN